MLEPLSLVAGTTSLVQVEAEHGRWTPGWRRPTPPGGPSASSTRHSAAAVPAEGRDRTAIASVTVAQPAAWVVALPADAVLTDLIQVMSERELSLAVVVDEATRDIRGLASAERINAVVGAGLSRRGRR